MKREIKFRAWGDDCIHTHEQLVHDWSMQDLVTDCDDGYTIMQFTGLTDKNGKEIFEGDVLAFERTKDFKEETVLPFAVTWDNENAGWINFSPKNMVVVIGNIHENPELL